MPSLARRFVVRQRRWSEQFDRLLPAKYRIDGNDDFKETILPRYLRPHTTIYDVGSGRSPYITPELKRSYNLTVVGIDIDQNELDHAPPNCYDRTICADLTALKGNGDADLVICEATLEHVKDTEAAFAALSTLPKPGARVAIFVPCRNAVYARLNRLLPEGLKRFLLFNLFPEAAQRHDGFKAYYNKCTPKDFRRMALTYGLEVELEKCYFLSNYFGFFLPLYVAWRLWALSFHALTGNQAAEAFVVVLRRSEPAATGPASEH